MNKTLTSLLMITIATSLVATGTFAYFSDTEVSTGNTFTAGTFDLTVDGANDPDVTTKVTLEDMAPGDWEVIGPIELKNVGTIDGIADLHFKNVVDTEDGMDSETYVGSSDSEFTEDPSGAVYDMSNKIWVDVWFDEDQDGVEDDGELIYANGEITLNELEDVDFDIGNLPAGETADLYLSFHLDSSTDNTYQGDYTTFDIEFTMHQDIDTSSGDTGHEEESEPQLPLNVDLTEVLEWNLIGRGSMQVTNQMVGFTPISGSKMAFIATGFTGPGTGVPVSIPPFESPFVAPFVAPFAVEGSSLYTSMVVPGGATTISIMYNFLTVNQVSAQVPPDGFTVVIVRNNIPSMVLQRDTYSVNNLAPGSLAPNVPGPSGFSWQTGWTSSGPVIVTPGETIEIYMTTYDGHWTTFDSGVLIDKVMFN